MTVCIRQARPEDTDEIIRLCREHAEFEKAEYCVAGKAEKLAAFLFSDTPRLYCLLVEGDDGCILGYATFMPEFSTWDAECYLHMDCLYLRPQARNQGIGRQLVKAIARRALEMGCRQIQWQTPSFNERALKFYFRIGATAKEKVRLFLDKNAIEALAEVR